ncbi:MAG: hypothetical protein ACK53L_02055, partial [Pirellulaceae bacterium]
MDAAPLVPYAAMVSPGVHKAAVLLMSLDEEDAALLLSRMPTKQVEAVSLAIAQMSEASGEEQERVINEFFNSTPSPLSSSAGGLDKAKTLVNKALGKEAGEMLTMLQQPCASLPFSSLRIADPQQVHS